MTTEDKANDAFMYMVGEKTLCKITSSMRQKIVDWYRNCEGNTSVERVEEFLEQNFLGQSLTANDYDTTVSAVVVALMNLCHQKVSRRNTYHGKRGKDTIKFVCNKFQNQSVRLL